MNLPCFFYQLPHVWGPKYIILNSNKQQLCVAQKGEVGDKVLHWNLKGQPHVLLDFCELKKTYHQGSTHTGIGEGVGPPPRADCDRFWVNMEGAQTDLGKGVGPPLRVGWNQSWASLGPPLTYMYIPGVQNVESIGAKVWRYEHFIPTNARHSPIDKQQ